MPIDTEVVVFTRPGKVEVRPAVVPDPGPDEVLVRTAYSGVSQGTERWLLLGRYNRMDADPAASYPCFPGYQATGVVVAPARSQQRSWPSPPRVTMNSAPQSGQR